MTSAARKVIEEALALTEEERELVMLELQASFEAQPPRLSPERDAELQASLDSVRSGAGESLEEVRRRVAARLAR